MDKVGEMLAERGSRYGDFENHARIAQALVEVMREAYDGAGPAWYKLSPAQRQALTAIADKIARILNGDPNYADNWHDIQGYARLVEERLPATSLDATPSAAQHGSLTPAPEPRR